jgi:hypothetical protein
MEQVSGFGSVGFRWLLGMGADGRWHGTVAREWPFGSFCRGWLCEDMAIWRFQQSRDTL